MMALYADQMSSKTAPKANRLETCIFQNAVRVDPTMRARTNDRKKTTKLVPVKLKAYLKKNPPKSGSVSVPLAPNRPRIVSAIRSVAIAAIPLRAKMVGPVRSMKLFIGLA
jgi:hypothetical protein